MDPTDQLDRVFETFAYRTDAILEATPIRWDRAEDIENHVRAVHSSERLHDGARALAERTIDMARLLVAGQIAEVERLRDGHETQRLGDASQE